MNGHRKSTAKNWGDEAIPPDPRHSVAVRNALATKIPVMVPAFGRGAFNDYDKWFKAAWPAAYIEHHAELDALEIRARTATP